MRIHREGYKILIISTLILIFFNRVIYYTVGRSLLYYTVLIASGVLLVVLLNFFRFPKRSIPSPAADLVVAPADGTVVVVEEVFEDEYLQENRIQVSIFMSLFNAHNNWIPATGKIIHSSHQKGRFMAAYLPKSSRENERSTVVIERANGQKILVRQIAGAMAKRIVTYVKAGDRCRINEELGFIKFGSRVDIFLPVDAEIKIKLEEKVQGNRTVLAKLVDSEICS